MTLLTIRSSRDRFAVSRVIHSPAAVRLNSGVRPRFAKGEIMNFKATVRVSRKSLSARIASPGSIAPDVITHRPPPQPIPSPSYRKERATRGMLGLTIHSSRRRFAARLNSGVRPRQSDLRNKSNATRLYRNVPRRCARAPLGYSPSDRFKRARQMFIRRRRCGLSLRSLVPGGSHAGARGNKPCRVYLRVSVRFLRGQGRICR